MPGCTIAICKTNTKYKNEEIILHSFPKDKNLRNVRIHKCKRKDKFNSETSGVCSKHFTSEDYERNLKAELLGIQIKKKLKSTAIPSQHLDQETPEFGITIFNFLKLNIILNLLIN